MKPFITALVLGALAWGISVFHPFDLAMPWQTGDSTSVNLSLQRIMGGSDFELVEAEWGRDTPLSYVAADGLFTATGQPSAACSQLGEALNNWGRLIEDLRNNEGCSLEAEGPGPMRATITVTEIERRQLQAQVRVQHVP